MRAKADLTSCYARKCFSMRKYTSIGTWVLVGFF